ncbi:MAG: GAF domain-containing protein [Nitrospirae bacterium]|nr:GAF domain-containing protein [Nitrospirota bacterium]
MKRINRSKKNIIILLRWLLIMVFLTMLLTGSRDISLVTGKIAYILLFVISNVALQFVPKEYFTKRYLDFIIILADTAIITVGIYLTNEIELYYVYFLSIIVGALGRSIKGSILVAFIASVFYFLIIFKTKSVDILQPTFLVRFPFFFIIALVSSFLAEDATVQREHLKRSRFLLNLGQLLSSTISANKIHEIVTENLSKLEGIDFCSTFQFDNIKNQLLLKRVWGIKDIEGLENFSILLSDIEGDIKEKIMQNLMPIVLNGEEIKKDEGFFPFFWPDAGSQVIVPIANKNALLGTINVGNRKPDYFDEETIEVLSIVSNQAASAFENARLFNDLGQNALELSSLSDIGKVISSTLDLKELLDNVMKLTSKVLGVEACSLLLLDEATNELVLIKGKIIGVAEAINKLDNKEFSERDFEFFNAIVNQAAIAIENAKLYKGMEDKVAETERLNKILYEEKIKIESILNSMAAGVVVVDMVGLMVFINNSAREILGYKRGNSSEKGPYFANLMELLKKGVISEKPEYAAEKTVIEGEGKKIRVFNTRVSPIKGRDEETLGAVGVLEDITELENLSELKSDFVSQVSHELRTPLTSVKGATKLILRGSTGAINEKQEKLLKIMSSDTDRLINLISDLLDISKLESGRIKMKKEDFNLSEILHQCIESVQSIVKDKNLRIFERFDNNIMVNADRDKIKQVVINLLSNAIKFTPADGMIELYARQVSGLSEVSVKDTGIGISKEFHKNIFEKFQRADNSMTAEVQGTGLGLAICKKIVEDHGGKIWVESEENNGSRFFFTLPA